MYDFPTFELDGYRFTLKVDGSSGYPRLDMYTLDGYSWELQTHWFRHEDVSNDQALSKAKDLIRKEKDFRKWKVEREARATRVAEKLKGVIVDANKAPVEIPKSRGWLRRLLGG